jgi:hypothetical protein
LETATAFSAIGINGSAGFSGFSGKTQTGAGTHQNASVSYFADPSKIDRRLIKLL